MQDFLENTKAAGSLFYPSIQLFLPTLPPATNNGKLFLLEAVNSLKQSSARPTPAYIEAGVTHLPILQLHYWVLTKPKCGFGIWVQLSTLLEAYENSSLIPLSTPIY